MINSVYRLIAPGMIEVACTEPDRTPDGRACMTIITTDDLDKKL